MNSFKSSLTDIYIKNPCGTQATPLWKTFHLFKDLTSEIQTSHGEISKLLLYNQTMIHTYLNKTLSSIDINNLNDFNTIILHQRYLSNINLSAYDQPQTYFRLIFDYSTTLTEPLMDGYYFKTVDIPNEGEDVSNLICSCYEHIKPSEDEVIKWTTHPVFAPNLWVWIVDKATNEYAGLGIAELDSSIGEGALEWIQILPKHQGKGLGKAIVTNLLLRLKDSAKFVTVSGEVDNKSQPEKLYRRCGFYGDDVWYVLRRTQVGENN